MARAEVACLTVFLPSFSNSKLAPQNHPALCEVLKVSFSETEESYPKCLNHVKTTQSTSISVRTIHRYEMGKHILGRKTQALLAM